MKRFSLRRAAERAVKSAAAHAAKIAIDVVEAVTPPPPEPGEAAKVVPIDPMRARVTFRDHALSVRKDAIKLPGDRNGPRWDVASPQLELEADFAAFCMAWWEGVDPPGNYEEIRRRALIATTVFHGVPIEDLPSRLRERTGE
jgi:hypothetical protein